MNCERCRDTKKIGEKRVYHPVTGKVVKKTPIPCPNC